MTISFDDWHKQERQAETFAAWLLIPPSEDPWVKQLSSWRLARAYVTVVRLAAIRRLLSAEEDFNGAKEDLAWYFEEW